MMEVVSVDVGSPEARERTDVSKHTGKAQG